MTFALADHTDHPIGQALVRYGKATIARTAGLTELGIGKNGSAQRTDQGLF